MAEKENSSGGMISVNELYTIKEFKRRLGLTEAAMRSLRRQGLLVCRVGKRAFVHGVSAMMFFAEVGIEDESTSSQGSFEIFGSALDVPGDGEDETEIGQDE